MMNMKDMAGLQRAASNAQNNIQKNLGEYFGKLDKQNNAIIDQMNDLLKAIVTNYELNAEIAKKLDVKIPKPLIEMKIE